MRICTSARSVRARSLLAGLVVAGLAASGTTTAGAVVVPAQAAEDQPDTVVNVRSEDLHSTSDEGGCHIGEDVWEHCVYYQSGEESFSRVVRDRRPAAGRDGALRMATPEPDGEIHLRYSAHDDGREYPPFGHRGLRRGGTGCSRPGSSNVNRRSLDHDEEVALVVLDDDVISVLESHFTDDLERSREIGLERWEERSPAQKALEAAVAPVRRWL